MAETNGFSGAKVFSGDRIKQLRTRLKLSQREFVEGIGITASALSAYEKGQKQPTISVAMNIAAKYNVSLDWLCGKNCTADSWLPCVSSFGSTIVENESGLDFEDVKDTLSAALKGIDLDVPLTELYLESFNKLNFKGKLTALGIVRSLGEDPAYQQKE